MAADRAARERDSEPVNERNPEHDAGVSGLEAFMRSRYAQATTFLRRLAVVTAAGCATQPTLPRIAGDWDAYFANGVTARAGFEGWRRMGFATSRQRAPASPAPLSGAPAKPWFRLRALIVAVTRLR